MSIQGGSTTVRQSVPFRQSLPDLQRIGGVEKVEIRVLQLAGTTLSQRRLYRH